MRATVFLLRRDGTRRPAAECADAQFDGVLEADFGHERWGSRSLTATLTSENREGSVLADLHKAHLTAAGPSGMIISGIEERFGRRKKDTLVERQSWAVSLLDVPLALMLLRQQGRRLTAEECIGRDRTEGTLLVERTRSKEFRAVFYDPIKAKELARMQSVELRRVSRKGIVLRGMEDLRGTRQRDSRLFAQAWWLMPSERPVTAGRNELDHETEDEYEMDSA